jgi:hypothetical protein
MRDCLVVSVGIRPEIEQLVGEPMDSRRVEEGRT